MKKNLLFMSLLLSSFVSFAQFEVKDKSDNSLLTEGQIISFSEAGCGFTDPCNFKFEVTNTSASEDIYMRIFVDNLVGTDGSDFQLCFNGVCLNNVTLNSGYPSSPALIAAGTTNSAGNNFWNQNPAGSPAMSWTFRFQAYNSDGGPFGTPLSVTYNYDSSLSVDESQLSQLEVFPTNVKNELTVNSNENLTAKVYDLLGRSVKQASILSGGDSLDISDLNSQIYIIRFTNEAGKTITKKIIKE